MTAAVTRPKEMLRNSAVWDSAVLDLGALDEHHAETLEAEDDREQGDDQCDRCVPEFGRGDELGEGDARGQGDEFGEHLCADHPAGAACGGVSESAAGEGAPSDGLPSSLIGR